MLELLLQPEWGAPPPRRGVRARLGPLALGVLAELLEGDKAAPGACAEARRALLLALRRPRPPRGPSESGAAGEWRIGPVRGCSLEELVDYAATRGRAGAGRRPPRGCRALRRALDEGLWLWHGKLLAADFLARPGSTADFDSEESPLEELLRGLGGAHAGWGPEGEGGAASVLAFLRRGRALPEKGAHAGLLELLNDAPMELARWRDPIVSAWLGHMELLKPWPLRLLTRILYWLERAAGPPPAGAPLASRVVSALGGGCGDSAGSRLGALVAASEFLICAHQEGKPRDGGDAQNMVQHFIDSARSAVGESDRGRAEAALILDTLAAVSGALPADAASEISSAVLAPLATALDAGELLRDQQAEPGASTPVKSEMDIYNSSFFAADVAGGRVFDVAAFLQASAHRSSAGSAEELAQRLCLISSLIRCGSQMELQASPARQAPRSVAYRVPPCFRRLVRLSGDVLVPGEVTSENVQTPAPPSEDSDLCGATALTVMAASLSELQCHLRAAGGSRSVPAGEFALKIAGHLVLASAMRTVIKGLEAHSLGGAGLLSDIASLSQDLILKSVGAWCCALQLVIDGSIQHDIEATAQAIRMETWHTAFVLLHSSAQPPVGRGSREPFKLLGPSLVNVWGCQFVWAQELPVLGPSFFAGDPGLFRSIVGFLHRSTLPSISASGYEGLRRCNAYAWAIVLRVLMAARSVGDQAVERLLRATHGCTGEAGPAGSASPLLRLCRDSLQKSNDACLPPLIFEVLDAIAEEPLDVEDLLWTAIRSLHERAAPTSTLDVLLICQPSFGYTVLPSSVAENLPPGGDGVSLNGHLATYYIQRLLCLPFDPSSKIEAAAKVVSCFGAERKGGGGAALLVRGGASSPAQGKLVPVGVSCLRRIAIAVTSLVSQLLDQELQPGDFKRAMVTLSGLFDSITDETHSPDLWEDVLPALVHVLEQVRALPCLPGHTGDLSVAAAGLAQHAAAFVERVVNDRPYCMSSPTPVTAVPAAVHHLVAIARELRGSLERYPASARSRIHDALNIANSSLDRIAACGSAPAECAAARAAAAAAVLGDGPGGPGGGGGGAVGCPSSDLEPSDFEGSDSESELSSGAFFVQEG